MGFWETLGWSLLLAACLLAPILLAVAIHAV